MKEDRESFKMEIDKLKKEEIENARNEVAKFKVLDENLDEWDNYFVYIFCLYIYSFFWTIWNTFIFGNSAQKHDSEKNSEVFFF